LAATRSRICCVRRRAGFHAALYAKDRGGQLRVEPSEIESLAREALEPFARGRGENPYAIQHELQETMQRLVGIIRTESSSGRRSGRSSN